MSLHQTELQYADLIFPPEVILQISIFKEIKQVAYIIHYIHFTYIHCIIYTFLAYITLLGSFVV